MPTINATRSGNEESTLRRHWSIWYKHFVSDRNEDIQMLYAENMLHWG